jgi:hypothetical protein
MMTTDVGDGSETKAEERIGSRKVYIRDNQELDYLYFSREPPRLNFISSFNSFIIRN